MHRVGGGGGCISPQINKKSILIWYVGGPQKIIFYRKEFSHGQNYFITLYSTV